MLCAKKRVAHGQEEDEEADIDCTWAVLVAKSMGFETEEALRMRYGELADYIITAGEMNKEKKKPEKEKSASLMDL